MRSLVIMITISLVLLAGCVTMPEKVPDQYLSEKTTEQTKNLEKMENAIISKNHEVQASKDKVEDAEQKSNIEKGRLKILKDEKKLLDEKQKQYQLENDGTKIGENAKLISEKEAEITTQVNRVEYATAFRDHAKAQKEVADAELSELVAELNYEKSKIAKEYLLKRKAVGTAENKDKAFADAEKYDEKYREYLDKQRESLTAKRTARDEAAIQLKIAEDKLKK